MMSLDNIPPEIQTLLDGASFHIVSSGASGAQVYRILRPDGSACYLKAADVPWQQEELLAEIEFYKLLDEFF